MMSGIDENLKGFALSSHGIYFKDDNIVSPYARDLIEMFDELKAGIRGNFNIT